MEDIDAISNRITLSPEFYELPINSEIGNRSETEFELTVIPLKT